MNELKTICINAIQTYLLLAGCAPGSRKVCTDAYSLITSPFAHPVSNFAYALNLNETSTQELASMAIRNRALRIHVFPTDQPSNADQLLADAGLEECYSLKLMACTGKVPEQRPVAREAGTADLPRIVRFIVSNFFWSSSLVVRDTMTEIMLEASKRAGQHYLVEYNGSLMACATLIDSPGATGIYNVCVRPEERGKGVGTALVAQLVAAARKSGALPCLQADEELESWYMQVGFRSFGSVRVFGKPD